VLALFAHALAGERIRWPADGLSLMKAEIAPAERPSAPLFTRWTEL
jgi:hypothetical protein